VKCSPCRVIRFICDNLRGKRFAAGEGDALREAAYLYRGGESVIRIECEDAEGRTAWTNPLYF
jgi:hypothetical protein